METLICVNGGRCDNGKGFGLLMPSTEIRNLQWYRSTYHCTLQAYTAHQCKPYSAPSCTVNTEHSTHHRAQCRVRRLRDMKCLMNGMKINDCLVYDKIGEICFNWFNILVCSQTKQKENSKLNIENCTICVLQLIWSQHIILVIKTENKKVTQFTGPS